MSNVQLPEERKRARVQAFGGQALIAPCRKVASTAEEGVVNVGNNLQPHRSVRQAVQCTDHPSDNLNIHVVSVQQAGWYESQGRTIKGDDDRFWVKTLNEDMCNQGLDSVSGEDCMPMRDKSDQAPSDLNAPHALAK